MATAPKPWEVNAGQQGASDTGPEVSSAPQELIDENDPRLISEPLDVNVDADAYAQPAPPPDGKYRAKLKLEGVKQEGTSEKKSYAPKNFGKPPVPAYATSISCQLIDANGKYDGIVLYPAFGGGVSTAVRRDNSSQVGTILARIKKPDGSAWAPAGVKMNPKEWMELLVKALATEPEIGVETSWEASCRECGEVEKAKGSGKFAARTTGMHHFPPETDAAKRKAGLTNSPEIKCAVNPAHGYSKARAIVTRFLHLHELK